MSTKLVWRRCATCAQLTLVPVSANVCWQCGAPLPEPVDGDHLSAESDPALGKADALPQRPWWPPFSRPGEIDHHPTERERIDPSLVERNLPPAKSRPMALTPEEDAVATRLLESVFPDGPSL